MTRPRTIGAPVPPNPIDPNLQFDQRRKTAGVQVGPRELKPCIAERDAEAVVVTRGRPDFDGWHREFGKRMDFGGLDLDRQRDVASEGDPVSTCVQCRGRSKGDDPAVIGVGNLSRSDKCQRLGSIRLLVGRNRVLQCKGVDWSDVCWSDPEGEVFGLGPKSNLLWNGWPVTAAVGLLSPVGLAPWIIGLNDHTFWIWAGACLGGRWNKGKETRGGQECSNPCWSGLRGIRHGAPLVVWPLD